MAILLLLSTSRHRKLSRIALSLLGILASASASAAPQPLQWSATDDYMANGRSSFTVTLLTDGRALAAAGLHVKETSTADLYDPVTGLWSHTGKLLQARTAHTATLLPDGRVLVAGGLFIPSSLAECELYDPATGIWSVTEASFRHG
jgi:hypothetical protein